MKLLIADDNPSIRRLIRLIVGKNFDEIFECENGFDAVQSFAKHKPDWVLMDIGMPRVDGLMATQSIMKDYPDAKVIILSENMDESIRVFAKKIGARAFATKDDLLKIRTNYRSIEN